MNQAEGDIGYLCSFLEYTNGLCEDDWKMWRPLIARACAQVKNEDFRKKGLEAMRFFNSHFMKNQQQP